jgi:methionyl-tRNA formyltransferase
MQLMDRALADAGRIRPTPQNPEIAPTYHRRRTPEDSRLDPHQSIASQFDLLRICDPDRYPAFFDFRGRRYRLRLEVDDE